MAYGLKNSWCIQCPRFPLYTYIFNSISCIFEICFKIHFLTNAREIFSNSALSARFFGASCQKMDFKLQKFKVFRFLFLYRKCELKICIVKNLLLWIHFQGSGCIKLFGDPQNRKIWKTRKQFSWRFWRPKKLLYRAISAIMGSKTSFCLPCPTIEDIPPLPTLSRDPVSTKNCA